MQRDRAAASLQWRPEQKPAPQLPSTQEGIMCRATLPRGSDMLWGGVGGTIEQLCNRTMASLSGCWCIEGHKSKATRPTAVVLLHPAHCTAHKDAKDAQLMLTSALLQTRPADVAPAAQDLAEMLEVLTKNILADRFKHMEH